MKTLAEAVAELNALPNPEEVLSQYPNKRPPRLMAGQFRCMTCPIAQHLATLTGKEIWVSSYGYARRAEDTAERDKHMLSDRIAGLIRIFDLKQYDEVAL